MLKSAKKKKKKKLLSQCAKKEDAPEIRDAKLCRDIDWRGGREFTKSKDVWMRIVIKPVSKYKGNVETLEWSLYPIRLMERTASHDANCMKYTSVYTPRYIQCKGRWMQKNYCLNAKRKKYS